MPRHSLRRNGRRLALALSLMLVAGAVAVPAFAGPPKEFSVDVDADLDGVVTITFFNDSRNTDLGAARIGVPADASFVGEGLAGPTGSTVEIVEGVIHATNLAIPRRSSATITFDGPADCGQTYTFADPQAKQSNDFSGTGNDLDYAPREGHSLTVATPTCSDDDDDDQLADFDEDHEQVDCGDEPVGETCTITTEGGDGQKVTASIAAQQGRIGLRNVGVGDDVADAVRAACEAALGELVGPARLGQAVVHLLPVDFDGDDDLVVTNLIPRSQVNTDENRSANIFQVCLASEKAEDGDPIDGAPGLYGPIMLPDCADDVAAPCVFDRQKVRADVVVSYRIPTEDPWLM